MFAIFQNFQLSPVFISCVTENSCVSELCFSISCVLSRPWLPKEAKNNGTVRTAFDIFLNWLLLLLFCMKGTIVHDI